MNQTPSRPAPPADARFRLLVLCLALASLLLTGFWMAKISRTDPWYRNTDMNIHNMADALAINSGLPQNLIDQPGMPLKFLLALDYRIQHSLGLIPIWNLQQFGDSADPLHEMGPLLRAGRLHSRILVLVVILLGGLFTQAVTRDVRASGLAVIMLCGSSSLVFHGLLMRPELLCVAFGNVAAFLCVWRAMETRRVARKYGWLFLVGLFCGFSALEKIPGVCYLALCYAWCWVGAFTRDPGDEAPEAVPSALRFRQGLPAAAAALSVLCLLFCLRAFHDTIGPVALLRLRLAAVSIGVLPLVACWHGRSRLWLFLGERARELALLGGGALASLSVIYLLERSVMAEANAGDYLARMLHFVADPASTVKLLIDNPDISQVFLRYIRLDPLLFAVTPVLAAGLFLVRSVPLRFKAFIALLLASALGLTLVLSKRHFTMHYGIFSQVPLLLACSLCLHRLAGWLREKHAASLAARWAFPVALGLSLVAVVTLYARLQPRYYGYQNDAALPVRELTVTFLFDHDSHTTAFRQIMSRHYGDRAQFTRTLELYLADPANRY